MKTLLNGQDLAMLKALVGSRFDSLAGRGLDDWLYAYEVLVVTDKTVLKIYGDEFLETFEGFPSEYSLLHVDLARPNELAESQQLGHVHKARTGEEITGVSVVRERVTYLVSGVEQWSYDTDSAIVFYLESSAVVLHKKSLDLGLVQVTYLQTKDLSGLADTDNLFEAEEHEVYRQERRVFTVDQLLANGDAW